MITRNLYHATISRFNNCLTFYDNVESNSSTVHRGSSILYEKRKKERKKEKFEIIWIREFGFVRKDENGHGCLILFFIETIVATSWMDIWSHKFRQPTLNPVKEMNIEERKDGELMVTNGWVCAQLRFYWKAGEKSGQILGGTRLERGNYRRKDELVSRDLRASNVEIFFKPCFF